MLDEKIDIISMMSFIFDFHKSHQNIKQN